MFAQARQVLVILFDAFFMCLYPLLRQPLLHLFQSTLFESTLRLRLPGVRVIVVILLLLFYRDLLLSGLGRCRFSRCCRRLLLFLLFGDTPVFGAFELERSA